MRCLAFIFGIFLAIWSLGISAWAQSTVIYSDDFEGTVSGWSDNRTEFDPDTTRFLGRFDNNPTTTQRTFTLPANTWRVDLAFDFYRFDSWDDTAQWGFDRFEIEIDGVQIFSLPFASDQVARTGTTGNVDWSHSPLGPASEFAFNTGQFWFDQKHRVNLTVNSPGSTVTLTLRTDINQGGNDESAGYDNISVTAYTSAPNLNMTKTVSVVGDGYSLPNAEVEYRFNLNSTGGEIDAGTIIVVDPIPPDLILFTGDLDGSGNPFAFTDNSSPASGLSCCAPGSYEFSDTTSGSPIFGYIPTTPYDPNVRYIRIMPTGTLRNGSGNPVSADIRFRAQIR